MDQGVQVMASHPQDILWGFGYRQHLHSRDKS